MSIEEVIARWHEAPDTKASVEHVEVVPAGDAAYEAVDPPLPAAVASRLEAAGISELYRHQARAVGLARSRSHVVIVAGTASGKSLGYQVPIADAIASNSTATALAIFPTKALAQDQLSGFRRFGGDHLVAATYDGDTDSDDRRWIRRHANVVLTNPDMLHVGILPHHERWKHFLGRLSFVVVDELHSFKGVFGSHVALVLRRLRRLAARYGADPVFVFTSATIGNPGELAAALAGVDVAVVDDDGAPNGEKHYVLWNPELEDVESGTRASPLADATRIFAELVGDDLHTIVFSRSRKASELIYRWARERLDEERTDRIAPYRAGYLAADRRRIEADLFSGRLLGVAATNALELGIDVGDLDAAVITTFPGTISSFRQQAGRAGRRQDASLAVLVAGQDALDQYYMHHPEDLFSRGAETAVVNPANPNILRSHIECAAYEAPLVPGDSRYLGAEFEEHVADLAAEGRLKLRGNKLFWGGGDSPARAINLRSSGGGTYRITAGDSLLGTVDEGRAFSQCHPGAVYLHQGDSYVVSDLDLDRHEVWVQRADVGYYTQPHVDKDLSIVAEEASRALGPVTIAHGQVEVSSEVLAYRRKSINTGQVLETLPVDLPRRAFTTDAMWITIPHDVVAATGIGSQELPGTLHAAEHTSIAMLPLIAICDRWDIGGLSTAMHPQVGSPVWFIYDGYPGGAGIAPLAFTQAERHLAATLEALETCPCSQGCPSCVQSPKCGNFNDPLSKSGARTLLEFILSDTR